MRPLPCLVVSCLVAAPAAAATNAETAVARCAAIYHASGHPCACPSDTMRNGRSCGHASAHDRAGGAAPVCAPSEVTPELANNPAALEARCAYHGR